MKKLVIALIATVSFLSGADDFKTRVIQAFELSKTLPKMVDADFKWDETFAFPDSNYYKYTLVNYTKDKVTTQMKNNIKFHIARSLCSNIMTINSLKNKIMYDYDLFDKNNVSIFKFQIKYDNCKK